MCGNIILEIDMKLRFKFYQGNYIKLNGKKNIPISKIELCRHTMMVGYKNAISFLNMSIYRHIELCCMVMACVNDKNGELLLKDDYFALDQSEKVCVSYQLGQGLTKAIAERYFNVPWVVHVKKMKCDGNNFNKGSGIKRIFDPTIEDGKEPDLIGYDCNGKLHVFEAKGSSAKKPLNSNIQKAINQVSYWSSMTDLCGKTDYFMTRNACIFNFSPLFHGYIIDPPKNNENIENYFGLLCCLNNYYYEFLDNDRSRLETIEVFGQKWNGYIFQVGDEKYFWGINSLCKEFMQEIYASNNSYLHTQYKEENYMLQARKILKFFDEQNYFDYNSNNFVSVGKDGYILCDLNNI